VKVHQVEELVSKLGMGKSISRDQAIKESMCIFWVLPKASITIAYMDVGQWSIKPKMLISSQPLLLCL
jgi:hypothetical protein